MGDALRTPERHHCDTASSSRSSGLEMAKSRPRDIATLQGVEESSPGLSSFFQDLLSSRPLSCLPLEIYVHYYMPRLTPDHHERTTVR